MKGNSVEVKLRGEQVKNLDSGGFNRCDRLTIEHLKTGYGG